MGVCVSGARAPRGWLARCTHMKHLVLGDTAFSWRQPSIEVASTVPFALPFFCQMDRATLQSKLTRPHGFSAGITK